MLTDVDADKFVAALRAVARDDETLAGQLDRVGDDHAIAERLRSDAEAADVVTAFVKKIGG